MSDTLDKIQEGEEMEMPLDETADEPSEDSSEDKETAAERKKRILKPYRDRFDRKKFSEILTDLNEDFNISDLGEKIGYSKGYLSGYKTENNHIPMHPNAIESLVEETNGAVDYWELMHVCGYFPEDKPYEPSKNKDELVQGDTFETGGHAWLIEGRTTDRNGTVRYLAKSEEDRIDIVSPNFIGEVL
jgi:hypothetical protein